MSGVNMQFYCRHCGELVHRNHPCKDPFPLFPNCDDEDLSDYFERRQFLCPCCGECRVDARLVGALENLRDLSGKDIEIVSAYRCPKKNENVLGPSRLAHLQGRAADIRIAGMTVEEMYELADRIYDFRHGGIGLNDDGTLHVDVRVFRARWRRVDGKYLGLGIKLCP